MVIKLKYLSNKPQYLIQLTVTSFPIWCELCIIESYTSDDRSNSYHIQCILYTCPVFFNTVFDFAVLEVIPYIVTYRPTHIMLACSVDLVYASKFVVYAWCFQTLCANLPIHAIIVGISVLALQLFQESVYIYILSSARSMLRRSNDPYIRNNIFFNADLTKEESIEAFEKRREKRKQAEQEFDDFFKVQLIDNNGVNSVSEVTCIIDSLLDECRVDRLASPVVSADVCGDV